MMDLQKVIFESVYDHPFNYNYISAYLVKGSLTLKYILHSINAI